MSLQFFDLATVPATPWKNGGGSTRELACWPLGAGMDAFGWRVSVATIALGRICRAITRASDTPSAFAART